MNLSPVPLFAIAPAAKLVVRGASQFVQAGRDFASYLTKQSDSPIEAQNASAASDHSISSFDQLLQPLRQFLRAQGFDSADPIALVADGTGDIRVDADPGLKEVAEGWLNQNPEWSQAWQRETSFRLSQLGPPNSRVISSIREEGDLCLSTPALRQQVLL